MKLWILFIFFFSSFPSHITQNPDGVCEYQTYQTTALLMEIFHTCLKLRLSYNWRATTSKLAPECNTVLFGHLFGFPPNNCACIHMCSRLLRVSVWKSLVVSCVWVKVHISSCLLKWPFGRLFSATENNFLKIRSMIQLIFLRLTSRVNRS